jgi:prepilin-type N-terminal cleavage/methylation domain-containing protein
MKRGFTLIELMIVIAIVGVLTAIVVGSYNDGRIRKEQDGIVQGLVSHLEKQKADAQAGKGGSSYGIKFEDDTYTLYTGTVYNAGSASNQPIVIDTDFEIEETIVNASNSIYFSRLNGSANENATITVSHILDAVDPRQITIETSGNISVVE